MGGIARLTVSRTQIRHLGLKSLNVLIQLPGRNAQVGIVRDVAQGRSPNVKIIILPQNLLPDGIIGIRTGARRRRRRMMKKSSEEE